jgi:hypothetical protein
MELLLQQREFGEWGGVWGGARGILFVRSVFLRKISVGFYIRFRQKKKVTRTVRRPSSSTTEY